MTRNVELILRPVELHGPRSAIMSSKVEMNGPLPPSGNSISPMIWAVAFFSLRLDLIYDLINILESKRHSCLQPHSWPQMYL